MNQLVIGPLVITGFLITSSYIPQADLCCIVTTSFSIVDSSGMQRLMSSTSPDGRYSNTGRYNLHDSDTPGQHKFPFL
jgi:hypothetical protein